MVTGDPIAAEDRGKVKGVFNFNSEKLIAFIRDLNRGARRGLPNTAGGGAQCKHGEF